MPTPVLDIRNGKYYAFWSDNRRSKRKSMGTSDRAVAEKRFGEWLLLGGHKAGATPEERRALTIAELWLVYDEQHIQKNLAAKDTAGFSWKNLKPHFGDLTPSEIDDTVIEDYEEKRLEGLIGRPSVSGTVRREVIQLRACLNWHADPRRAKKRLLDKADVPVFQLPDESGPRDRWLTTDEIEKLFSAVREMHARANRMSRLERFLWLALETAARRMAILELTWDRVDFKTGMIHYAVPGRRVTKKRRPSVPISDKLRPVLERMFAERLDEDRKDGFVLDHSGDMWAHVQTAVIRAGLAPKPPKRKHRSVTRTGISPHTFRHTAATHMARNGTELWAVAGVLGNSVAMVEKVYAKHCPARLRAAVNTISAA